MHMYVSDSMDDCFLAASCMCEHEFTNKPHLHVYGSQRILTSTTSTMVFHAVHLLWAER